ncbi:MAG: DUF5721 family protein [Butyrivibrio sp.]|nr:DUF5721 family protein [Butyrivibrio sp.]
MIAIKITKQKNFMSKLLTTDLFDLFLLEEAEIETYNTFRIDGRIHREYYKDSFFDESQIPAEEFSRWGKLRPICLELIKGKVTPLSFRFVLHLDNKSKEKLISQSGISFSPDQISFGLNISFSSGEVVLTTGISTNVFTLDKSAEKAWDQYVPGFMESNGISTEIL